MIQMAQVATTKVITRIRRTSIQRVQNPGQALLAIVKLAIVEEDIEAGSKRRTLARRRWHHPFRSDVRMGRIHQGRSKA